MQRKTAFVGDGDRYAFDFKLCTTDKGWAQLDTAQDAWYFGNWANPFTRELMHYAEGDVSRVTCETDDEFTAEVRRVCDWYAEHDGNRPGLDPGFNAELKAQFERLGLAEWLH